MSEQITITIQPPADAPPTVTHYQQFAAELMTALDQILSITPKLDEAEASGRKVAASRLSAPEEFIATVVAAVEQLPELAAAKKLDPVATRDKLQYIAAVKPVFDKIVTVAKRLNFTLLYLKDSMGGESLQVYRIARQHASDNRSPVMAAHVANMKRALAKKVPTKAEREQRKLARMLQAFAEFQQKEVQKAA